jgi:hypothetical protein
MEFRFIVSVDGSEQDFAEAEKAVAYFNRLVKQSRLAFDELVALDPTWSTHQVSPHITLRIGAR